MKKKDRALEVAFAAVYQFSVCCRVTPLSALSSQRESDHVVTGHLLRFTFSPSAVDDTSHPSQSSTGKSAM